MNPGSNSQQTFLDELELREQFEEHLRATLTYAKLSFDTIAHLLRCDANNEYVNDVTRSLWNMVLRKHYDDAK